MKKILNNKLLLALLLLVLFLLAFAVRFKDVSSRSVWMDEAYQAQHASLGIFGRELMVKAATQEQPPLDYCLQWVGISLFGFSEIGIRIHAVLMGAFACVLFFVFLLRHYGIQSSLLGYVLFTFNPWLIRYSTEGRPYSAGVFFAVLFIFIFHEYVKKRNLKTFLLFCLAQFLFLVSVGFQSILLIFLFALISVFLVFLFERQSRIKTPVSYHQMPHKPHDKRKYQENTQYY